MMSFSQIGWLKPVILASLAVAALVVIASQFSDVPENAEHLEKILDDRPVFSSDVQSCIDKLQDRVGAVKTEADMEEAMKNLKQTATVRGVDGRKLSDIVDAIRTQHKVAHADTKLTLLFPSNTVVTADSSSCEITGLFMGTKDGKYHPDVEADAIEARKIAVDKRKKPKPQSRYRWRRTPGNRIRIIAGSCSQQEKRWLPLYKLMLEAKPEHIFLMGDNVYLDMRPNWLCRQMDKRNTRKKKRNAMNCFNGLVSKVKYYRDCKQIRAQYNRFLNSNQFLARLNVKMKSKAAVWMTWDDHDYGKNNQGANNRYKSMTRREFVDYWGKVSAKFPNRKTRNVINMLKRTARRNRGIYYTSILEKRLSDGSTLRIRLYSIDVRWYRNKKGSSLGHAQKRWLQWLINTQSRGIDFHVFVSGLTLFFRHKIRPLSKLVGPDSWSNGDKNFLFHLLRKNQLTEKSLILSGDVHFSTINAKNGLYEIVSSGLTHAVGNFLGKTFHIALSRKNTKSRYYVITNNFAVVDIGKNGWEVAYINEYGNPVAEARYSFSNSRKQHFWTKVFRSRQTVGE